MPQVLFTRRSGAYWPGANPVLGDDIAGPLLRDGVAVPYTEETAKKLSQQLARGGGMQLEELNMAKDTKDQKPDGNDPNQPVINRAGEPVPTEYEPKLRGTTGAMQTVGKTEAQEKEDAELAKAEKQVSAAAKAAPRAGRKTRASADAKKPADVAITKRGAKGIARAAKAAKKAEARDLKGGDADSK